MRTSDLQGIKLFFSHSVERLADKLARKVVDQQSQQNIFSPLQIMVPNGNMQRYLQLHIAKQQGICANVEFPFLETGLFQMVNQVAERDSTHLNGSLLSWKIWQLLKSSAIQDNPVYQPLQKYMAEGDGKGLITTKQFQLSQKLAMLLLDYESQRPEMVRSWLADQLFFNRSNDEQLKQLEAMQKDIYQRVIQKASQNNTDDQCFSLLQAADSLQQFPAVQVDKAIHIFTPSRISQLHRQLMLQLAQYMAVNIYQLNVCMEYWEDMQTKPEQHWQQGKLTSLSALKVIHSDQEGDQISAVKNNETYAELVANPDENPLLQAWGKPGREVLKLFSETENDALYFSVHFNDHWLASEDDVKPSLLQHIQSSVINRTTQLPELESLSHLSSLQMASAPSIYREVQAVYHSILWNLKINPQLMLNEVAVLVTDMSQYRYVIEQVFVELNQQLQTPLSFTLVDSSADMESRYAAAVSGLFKVLDDDFLRSSVFEWLDNPCVQAANNFTPSDWNEWLLVADRLGIYGGYEQLYPADSAKFAQLYTWQRGLKKLRKSLVIEDQSLSLGFIDAENIGQFSALLETLQHHRHRLNQARTTIQWEALLNRMFLTFIAVPADENKEQAVQMALQQSLLNLAKSQPDLVLEYADIKLFIQYEIQQIPASRGNYLTGGVVCAALQPMRPIPFKITYVLGLDEKSFPGKVVQETLDLTTRSRRIGDINSVENKNYLFLETLMCTREKLYLSYVGLDLVKDERIEPSPVLLTLKDYCEGSLNFKTWGLTEFPVLKIPLNSSDDLGFDHQKIVAHDLQVNFSYGDFLINRIRRGCLSLPEPKNTQQSQQLKVFKEAEAHFKTVTDNEHCISETEQLIQVNAIELAAYLENPQLAILKKQGITSRHTEDLSLVENEPMQLSGLLKHQIFNDAVNDWLNNRETADFSELLDQHYQVQLEKSQVPLPFFTQISELSCVEDDLCNKLKVQLQGKSALGVVQLGDAAVTQTPGMTDKAVMVNLDSGLKIQINGALDGVFGVNQTVTDVVVISNSSKHAAWHTKCLRPFINWCLWQLSEKIVVHQPLQVHLVFPKKIHSIQLQPWYGDGISFATRSTVESYLKMLLTAYLNHMDDFLPSGMANSLKVSVKADKKPQVPFLKATSKAKQINYMAYAESVLDVADRQRLKQIYEDQLNWPAYQEVLNLFEVKPTADFAALYRQFLLPLLAMVEGEFEELAAGDV